MRYRPLIAVLAVLASFAITTAYAETLAPKTTAFVTPAAVNRCLRSYEAEGHPIKAGFVPYSTEVVAGEPVIVTFTLVNSGSEDIQIPRFGARGYDSTYSFTAIDANGEKTKLVEAFGECGGKMWSSTLAPKGMFFHPLFVSDYIQALQPGTYTITCVRPVSSDPFGSRLQLPEIKSEFTLTVLPPNPTRLGRAIKRLGQIIEAGPRNVDTINYLANADTDTTAKALKLIDDERTIPYLVAVLKTGGMMAPIYALDGLSKYPSEVVLPAVKDMLPAFLAKLKEPGDSFSRSGAVRALRTFRYPEAADALIKVLNDSDEWVRRDVADALGDIGDRKAIEPVKGMLHDRSNRVVLAAINSLVKLGEKPELKWFDPIFDARDSDQLTNAAWGTMRNMGQEKLAYFASKLDLNDPTKKNYKNYVLVNELSAATGEKFTYLSGSHDDDGTAEEQEQNLAVMRELQSKFLK